LASARQKPFFNGISIAHMGSEEANRRLSPLFPKNINWSSHMSLQNHGTSLACQAAEATALQETEIVTAAQQGSSAAFAELYRLYSRRLYSTIFAITKSPEDTEDALQETFLRVHRAIRTFEGRSSIYTWLTRIAMNSALMVLRKRRNRSEILFDVGQDGHTETGCFEIEDSGPGPEHLCDMNQRWVRLLQALGTLDETLGGPIWMQIVNGASVKEIGQTLQLSEVAVKARLHRARLRLSAACQSRNRETKKSFEPFIPRAFAEGRSESCPL
jgi:RNA polymerase sigma-70 factor, ECF subfamily